MFAKFTPKIQLGFACGEPSQDLSNFVCNNHTINDVHAVCFVGLSKKQGNKELLVLNAVIRLTGAVGSQRS